jgi:hypothetical protein
VIGRCKGKEILHVHIPVNEIAHHSADEADNPDGLTSSGAAHHFREIGVAPSWTLASLIVVDWEGERSMSVRIAITIPPEDKRRRDAVFGTRRRELPGCVVAPPRSGSGTEPAVPRVQGRRRD